MVDLILRPSTLSPGRPWALQLRYHESCGPTEYHTLCRLSDNEAREVMPAGAPFWLFSDPNQRGDNSRTIPKIE